MGSIFSFLTQVRLPKGIDKATEMKWNCAICQDARDDLTYVMPCLHQFCLSCIMRWAEMQTVCPLCREPIESVKFSVKTDSYIDCVFTSSAESENASNWAGITLGQLVKHSFVESPSRSPWGILRQAEQGGAGTEPVGGLLPSVWAELFQREEHLLDPAVRWLRQELQARFGTRWWMARIGESMILHAVSICGPARNVLVHVLQDFFEEHTEPLIQGMIDIIVSQCSEEAQRLLQESQEVPEDNPLDSSSSFQVPTTAPHSTLTNGSADSSDEHQPTILVAVQQSAPTPAEQEELGEEVLAEEPAREEDNSTLAISISPQEDNLAPQAAPVSSPLGPSMEDQPSTSEAVSPTLLSSSSAPIPAEQEELEPAAVADDSAQGSSHSPSTPSQRRDPLPRRPRRSTRRRAASHLDSPQPFKRPPNQQ